MKSNDIIIKTSNILAISKVKKKHMFISKIKYTDNFVNMGLIENVTYHLHLLSFSYFMYSCVLRSSCALLYLQIFHKHANIYSIFFIVLSFPPQFLFFNVIYDSVAFPQRLAYRDNRKLCCKQSSTLEFVTDPSS